MKILNKLNRLYKIYYTSSSEKYIKYLKRKGVEIGDGTIIFDPKHIRIDITRPELVKIGKHVFLHKGINILTHDYSSWCFVDLYNDFVPSHAKVAIGNNVWFGENVTILKGVSIGNNCIIGYGSIVTKSIPDNSVAVGCPARVICSIEDYYNKRKIKYVDECFEYAKAIYESGQELSIQKFSDDYILFTDGKNWLNYDFPYEKIFNDKQFEIWKEKHEAIFKDFDDFCNAVKEKYGKY